MHAIPESLILHCKVNGFTPEETEAACQQFANAGFYRSPKGSEWGDRPAAQIVMQAEESTPLEG